jgi:hypothetical protein
VARQLLIIDGMYPFWIHGTVFQQSSAQVRDSVRQQSGYSIFLVFGREGKGRNTRNQMDAGHGVYRRQVYRSWLAALLGIW